MLTMHLFHCIHFIVFVAMFVYNASICFSKLETVFLGNPATSSSGAVFTQVLHDNTVPATAPCVWLTCPQTRLEMYLSQIAKCICFKLQIYLSKNAKRICLKLHDNTVWRTSHPVWLTCPQPRLKCICRRLLNVFVSKCKTYLSKIA